ncbi:hypothetical protein CL630_01630 [bacterium]|nr:hypothetical protein [bacterium]|tara:strand:- start:265 stop:585 length:321 start_codon:yes stop_codon:yes gene_type:complete
MFNFLFPPKPIRHLSHARREEYGIPSNINLSFDITNDGWTLVTSPDLPGLVTQAKNSADLLEMVNDAVLTYYDVPQMEANQVFGAIHINGKGIITSNSTNLAVAGS